MTRTPNQLKPCLSRSYSVTLKRVAWFCKGSGFMGFCDTPKGAYANWVKFMQIHRIVGPA